jgi:ribosomal protein S18 acetylase RimI-like enzyme
MNAAIGSKALIQYREFRNGDSPQLAQVWCSQSPRRGLMQPMSSATFESNVLAKPMFDRAGLIVAVDDGKLIGFIHAGFGPSGDQCSLGKESGVISMLMTRGRELQESVAESLLSRGEEYLRLRGAKILHAGATQTLDAFYMGMCGGSEVHGILDSDQQMQQFYRSHGYQEVGRSIVLERDLRDFRPPVDRRHIVLRRRATVQRVDDPPARSWWDACVFGPFDRMRFELVPKEGGPPLASATFWDMQGMSNMKGARAMGLTYVEARGDQRRQGIVSLLLAESFKQLSEQGLATVETQVDADNQAAISLFHKLGFREVDQAAVYRKEVMTASDGP